MSGAGRTLLDSLMGRGGGTMYRITQLNTVFLLVSKRSLVDWLTRWRCAAHGPVPSHHCFRGRVSLLGWTLYSPSCASPPFELNQKGKQTFFQFTAIVSCIINVINQVVGVCLFGVKTRRMIIGSQNKRTAYGMSDFTHRWRYESLLSTGGKSRRI